MKPEWFRTRGYKHLDSPVGEAFAFRRATKADFVEQHAWLPLIHYVKLVRRYKPTQGKTVLKPRDIMYASHRDACILAKYAHELSARLDDYYATNGISSHVIAYRKLGRSNYDFSADAYRYCIEHTPCIVLCFDITGFFDHLDHGILKDRLKRITGTTELPNDWYKVFRHVTRFRKIEREDLAEHAVFGPRLKLRDSNPVAGITEVKAAGIPITHNENDYGIPQGTPISSALSNLYMIDIDTTLAAICLSRGALYQRYADDILVACQRIDEADIVTKLTDAIEAHKLEIKAEKTERAVFGTKRNTVFQYLGFNISPQGACIRPGSLSRQWRKLRRSVRHAKHVGGAAVASGKAAKIYTKNLRRKLSPVGARNFSSYARRSATALQSKTILHQIRRIERAADKAIRELT
jgi:RNA-directed DNA polymerase